MHISSAQRNPPPHIHFKPGYRYVMLHKSFVDGYLFRAPEALELLAYSKASQSPDEFFLTSLLYSSPFRDTMWNNNYKFATWSSCCTGYIKTEGHPCVLGACNIPALAKVEHLFVNKIDSEWDDTFVDEMKKVLCEREEQELSTGKCNRIPLVETRTQTNPDYRSWRGDFSQVENVVDVDVVE